MFVSDASRKGFLETGLGGGSRGESWPAEEAENAGDAARLRKGLFDDRLSVNP